jgi:DNA adenine methylase
MTDFQLKPFIKWVGGKTQILDEIEKYIPKEMNNYHEPFIGGGSVLFHILNLINDNKIVVKGNIYVYDLNETLINTYKNIQTNHKKLYKIITILINKYDNITTFNGNKKPQNEEEALSSKESYYYWLRHLYNKSKKKSIKKSALFIILNKLCFRGLYREGPNGFNVPFGNYKKTPHIISKEYIAFLSDKLKNIKFECCDFTKAFDNFKKGDFVYLDPPYVPESKKSFVDYNKSGFNIDKHNELFSLIKKLDSKFLLSNSYTDKIIEEFKDYTINKILCKRSINSKNPESKTYEVIINN